jgi:hypothetical protein
LLDACKRPNDVLVIVEKHGALPVTPLGPVGHSGEYFAYGFHEMLALDFVEGVAEVDLQQPELGFFVSFQGVAKGVSNYLDSTWATNSVVATFEGLRNLVLSRHAKALGH